MMDPSKGGPKMRKKSPKVKTKGGGTPVIKQDAATAETSENASLDAMPCLGCHWFKREQLYALKHFNIILIN